MTTSAVNTGDSVTDANLHTIIAALRFWQEQGMCEPANRSDEMHDLATNGDEVMSSLDDTGVDELVMNLNTGACQLSWLGDQGQSVGLGD